MYTPIRNHVTNASMKVRGDLFASINCVVGEENAGYLDILGLTGDIGGAIMRLTGGIRIRLGSH
jgi:hypothetical protein